MKKEFCIVTIAGRFNKFHKKLAESNLFDKITIDSHKDFDCNDFLEKIKNYPKLIFVLALGSRSSFVILCNILKFVKKEFLLIVTTPFNFEGKRKNENSNQALEYLEDEKINRILITSKSILDKYYSISSKTTVENVYECLNLEIIKNIEKITNYQN